VYLRDGALHRCTLCAQNCPVAAIAFTPLERAEIDPSLCTRCDICRQGLSRNAIEIADTNQDNGRTEPAEGRATPSVGQEESA
jgi:ferredoxin